MPSDEFTTIIQLSYFQAISKTYSAGQGFTLQRTTWVTGFSSPVQRLSDTGLDAGDFTHRTIDLWVPMIYNLLINFKY
jgi:hypothetical protein